MESFGTFLIGLGPTVVAWIAVVAVVAVVAAAAAGKLALVMDKLAWLLVKTGEGEANKGFREDMKEAVAKESPVLGAVLDGMASVTDPKRADVPPVKRFGRALLGSLVKGWVKRKLGK